jgi:uncharacterized protein
MNRRLFCSLPLAALAAEKPRVVMLTGLADEPYHRWRETTPQITAALERFDVRLIEDARALTAHALKDAKALVINYNGPRLSTETERAIEQFVRNGGGLVAFHHASYGEWFGMVQQDRKWTAGPDAGWTAWGELIGATWKPENIGHSARHVFTAEWTDAKHPIATAKPVIANDELYHKLDLKPHAKVLLSAYSDPNIRGTGKREPILRRSATMRRLCISTVCRSSWRVQSSGQQQVP